MEAPSAHAARFMAEEKMVPVLGGASEGSSSPAHEVFGGVGFVCGLGRSGVDGSVGDGVVVDILEAAMRETVCEGCGGGWKDVGGKLCEKRFVWAGKVAGLADKSCLASHAEMRRWCIHGSMDHVTSMAC